MDELIFAKQHNLKISPKTKLPTKYQKVNMICTQCFNCVEADWRALRNYVINDLPYLCKSCRNGNEITKYNKNNLGKTIEERLGAEKGKNFRKKMSEVTSGKNNGMYGKHFTIDQKKKMSDAQLGRTYVDKFGKEKADELKKNLSEKFSGKNNPMYGKPSPQGSGNGWSGWYKGLYFRSLLELSFLVENPTAKSAEGLITITYIDEYNNERTYRPDFMVDNTLIEIKPKKLCNTINNLLKWEAAKKYCIEHNLLFKVLTENDINKLKTEDVNILYYNKEIKFIRRYEKKFQEMYMEENTQCH